MASLFVECSSTLGIRFRNKNNYRPAVFLHIQKTAGSSIVHYAKKYYAQVMTHADFVGKKPEDLADIKFVSGHFGYTYAKPLMAAKYSFTFLRDPVDRVLSMYYFCRNTDSTQYEMYQQAKEMELEEILEKTMNNDVLLRSRLWNNQAWQLAHGFEHGTNLHFNKFSVKELCDLAIEHLDDFSYIGFTETFDTDRDQIFKDLGLPVPKRDTKINVNKDRLSPDEISPGTLEMIHEITQADQAVYDEAWARRGNK